MKEIKYILFLLDREPEIETQAWIYRACRSLYSKDQEYSTFITFQTRAAIEVIGAFARELADQTDHHVIASAALSGFRKHWGVPPNFDAFNYQQLQGRVGIAFVEWVIEGTKKPCDVSDVPALFQALKHINPSVRRHAEATLGEIGAPAVPTLLQALQDRDKDIRAGVSSAFYHIRDVSAVPILLQALQGRNRGFHEIAARALGHIGDTSAVPALLQALQDSNEDVRERASSALGRIKDASAVPALTKALQDSNQGVRKSAARALGEIGDTSAVPALTKAFQDSNEDSHGGYGGFHEIAAEALGRIKDASAVPALTKALQNGNENIRRYAVKALSEVGGPSAVPALLQALQDSNKDVHEIAIAALGKTGAHAVPALTKALQAGNENIRWRAIRALDQIGDASAVLALTKALQDSNEEIRRIAARALGKIGDPRSLPRKVLAEKHLSPQQRADTLTALRRLRYRERFLTLRYPLPNIEVYCKQLLEDRETVVREGAQAVLAWLDESQDRPTFWQRLFRQSA